MTVFKIIAIFVLVFVYSCNQGEDKISKVNSSKSNLYGVAITDTLLIDFWKHFSNVINLADSKEFKRLSLSQVYCCDSLLPTDLFINKSFKKIFDKRLLQLFSDSSRIEYSSLDTREYSILNTSTSQNPKHKTVQIVLDNTPGSISIFEFDFIKTNDGLKFYGCNSYGEVKCCS